jgi:hypothetical protein
MSVDNLNNTLQFMWFIDVFKVEPKMAKDYGKVASVIN